MSINITLHSNFNNNNQDNRMLNHIDYTKKKELERRKLLRIEQVREQSKVLAKNIRKRYEEEKKRQKNCMEQRKTRELKQWQRKNVEKYRKEYEKCLKNVGTAHKAAMHQGDESPTQVKAMNQRTCAAEQSCAGKIQNNSLINIKERRTVSMQTEINPLTTTYNDSNTKTLQVLDNISIPSVEVVLGHRPDHVNPDNPIIKYNPVLSKTILSSTDDEEEIKVLTNITKEENKRNDSRDARDKHNLNFNYDLPWSDYKYTYYPQDISFNQVSELILKHQRPALTKSLNYSSALNSSRSLMDREKLEHLVEPALKPYYYPIVDPFSKQPQFQPSNQEANTIDQAKQKNQNDLIRIEKHKNRRQHKKIPINKQSKTAKQQQNIQQLDEISEQIEKLTVEKSHWKPYDISEYDFSSRMVVKEGQLRKNRLETAFKGILNHSPVVNCPKINHVSGQTENNRISSVNVAELLTNEENGVASTVEKMIELRRPLLDKVSPEKKVSETIKVRKMELNLIDNMEVLKDPFERMHDQKQSLLYEIEQDKKVPEITRDKETIKNVQKESQSLSAKKDENVENQGKDKHKNEETVTTQFATKIGNIVQHESSRNTLTFSELRHSTKSEQLYAPLKILIKVHKAMPCQNYKKKTGKTIIKEKIKNQLKDYKDSKDYPKTPWKKTTLQTDTNKQCKETDKTLQQKIYVSEVDCKLSEVSGGSGTTMYRDPPLIMKTDFSNFLDRITRKKFKERHKKSHTTKKATKKTQYETLFKSDEPWNPQLSYYIFRLLRMPLDSIDQLGVTTGSEIPTPNTSVINVSNNISTTLSLEQIEHLKRFVTENKTFINEVNEKLKKKIDNGSIGENVSVVEHVWMKTLAKLEKKIKKSQNKNKINTISSSIKRKCNKRNKSILKYPIKKKFLSMNRPKTSIICNNTENTKLYVRSKRANPCENRYSIEKTDKSIISTTNLCQMPVSPLSESLVTLDSSRNELATNINEIIEEVEFLRVAGIDENQLLDKYAELTENCSKRISELAKLIERTRIDNRMTFEVNHNLTEEQNSTEYINVLPPVSQDSYRNLETISYQEENTSLMDQMKKIGKSRDSGISLSRPVTTSDFRGSTEHVIHQQPSHLISLFNGIPRINSVDISAEKFQEFSGFIEGLDNSKLRKSKPNILKPKLPSFMTINHPKILPEQLNALSTIVETESSFMSRHNISKEKLVPKLTEKNDFLIPESFPNFDEYLKMRVKQFTEDNINRTDYTKTSLETNLKVPSTTNNLRSIILKHLQSSAESLKEDIFGDIYEELKRRKIIDRSVEPESISNANSSSYNESILTITSTENDEEQSISFLTDMKPKKSSKEIVPSLTKKPKHVKTNISHKKLLKESNNIEPNKGEPKTQTKTKNAYKICSPKKHCENYNWLKGFRLLQECSNKKMHLLEVEMNKLGMDWAVSTMRRTQEAQLSLSSSSTMSENASRTKTANNSDNPDKPIRLKEFLTREVMFRTLQSNSSDHNNSLSSQFFKSLMNISQLKSSHSKINDNSKEMDVESEVFKRTSTPLQERSDTPSISRSSSYGNSQAATTQLLKFSAESDPAFVNCNDFSISYKNSKQNNEVFLKALNVKNVDQYGTSNSE